MIESLFKFIFLKKESYIVNQLTQQTTQTNIKNNNA